MTLILLAILKIAVSVLVFAIGSRSTLADLTFLWRHPALMLRSFFVMYVLVPLAVLGLIYVMPVSAMTKAALLVLAVSAGAPLLPRKLDMGSSSSYVFSLVVTSSLLAIVLVPFAVTLLNQQFGTHEDISTTTVAWVLAKAFLLPLLAGMLAQWLLPELCERYSDKLMSIAGVLLAVAALILLAIHWQVFAQIHWRDLAVLLLAMILAVVLGHVFGGPNPDNRTVLAVACATRHIGIAVLVAGAFPNTNTLAVVLAYSLASAAVSIPYLVWRGKKPQSPK